MHIHTYIIKLIISPVRRSTLDHNVEASLLSTSLQMSTQVICKWSFPSWPLGTSRGCSTEVMLQSCKFTSSIVALHTETTGKQHLPRYTPWGWYAFGKQLGHGSVLAQRQHGITIQLGEHANCCSDFTIPFETDRIAMAGALLPVHNLGWWKPQWRWVKGEWDAFMQQTLDELEGCVWIMHQ